MMHFPLNARLTGYGLTGYGLVVALGLVLAQQYQASAEVLAPLALDRLPAADIVVLGEVHDNAEHHLNQARAVAAIAPRALVWEMLTPEQAARMPEDRQDAQAVAEAVSWEGSGWPEFDLYHPILLAAPEARVYGAGVPRQSARRVFEEPAAQVFADLFGAEADTFGLENALLPADQTAREAEQAEAHCHALPAHLLPGMVSAQRLRDAALAHKALQALADTGGPVVVIAGSGHARNDIGIPALLRQVPEAPAVISLGQIEADPGRDAPFDYWIVTEPASRSDPCDSLR